MDDQKFPQGTTINGFFTKIVSLMFICSAFASGVDAASAQAGKADGMTHEKVGAADVYLDSSILSSNGSATVFGSTIPGAHLEVKHPSGTTYRTIADATGHFKISGLPSMNTGDTIDIIASAQDLKISEHLQYDR
ncbi:carboxypeptidase-like regulatory domain-containing protein [Lacicoccus alkaliphilus]|uniref:Bacterial Ig domain-containing protein n=1 Tax=Lacicoccus alkaliphilus DSM 16010 TaxID=1123231 RepID=A0A1M7KIC2_9BACL|nr:carboxypeptidase-like regulatory domain-containing protein [Salinicoccus alkaliphilus]SHM65111.1 hypothetical protein SAMN02745189_02555 [Salinicoccus alkaliphilus DSM 16010]